MERAIYKTIADEQSKKHNVSILHLYGIPGSGKTEIVRKLAQDFPYDTHDEVTVKKEVDLSDNPDDLRTSLKDLLKEMLDHNLVLEADCKSACMSLDKGNSQALVKALCDSNASILIMIQDAQEANQDFLNDLVSSLKQVTSVKPIHFYVTSNVKSTLRILEVAKTYVCGSLPHSNVSASEGTQQEEASVETVLPIFKDYEIAGLQAGEGLTMLGVSENDTEEEQIAAGKITDDLSGSPLGLIAVENHCRTSGITYSDYLELKTFWNYNKIIDTFSFKHKHVFEAVIRLLDTKESLLNKMKTVAMFHHGDIPRRLIGKVMQTFRNVEENKIPVGTYLNNKQESGMFISQLEDFSICEVDKHNKNPVAITFHRVVFSAMQALLKSEESTQYAKFLKQAILALSSVVNKDLRRREDLVFMKRMSPHIQAILQNFDNYAKNMSNSIDFLENMAVIHLREVFGAVNSDSLQGLAEKSLITAGKSIWKEVLARSASNLEFHVFIQKQSEGVAHYAEQIIAACLEAGEDLKNEGIDITEYISTVLQVKEEDVDFLCTLTSSEKIQQYLRKISKFSLTIPSEFLKLLDNKHKGIFLERSLHRKLFFVDRLVSIVYSLGRIVLYDDEDITAERREKFLWIIDLAKALCVECNKVTGVNILFQILTAFVQLEVRLKKTAGLDADGKKALLQETRKVAERNLTQICEEKEEAFENGLRKSVIKNVFQELTSLRTLVRIDAKLWHLCNPEELVELQKTSNLYYQQLHEKANEAMETWKQSPKCIVYCGKYLAAKGDYEGAVLHFRTALDTKFVKGDKSKAFPWVCYNHLRAVRKGNLVKYQQDAMERGNEAIKHEMDIADDLLVKLKSHLPSV